MSWEEYKKKREETSSWEQYKQKRQANVAQNTVTTKNSANNKTSLWDNIQNFANDTSKTTQNTLLGLKNGLFSSVQTVDRKATNNRVNATNLVDNLYKLIFKKDVKTDPMMMLIKNNTPQLSQETMQEETQERYDEIQEKKNENTLKIQENTENTSSAVGKYLAGEIAPSIGQMLPGMFPGGTGYFITSAAGNYYDDALQRGMSKEQANVYGDVMGVIEGSLETVGADLSKKVGKQLLKKNIKGALVNYGLDIGENFLEESIVEPLSEIVATTTAGKDKADWSNIGQRMWEKGIAGAITSAITGGASGAIGAAGSKITQQNKYVDYNTNKKLDKNTQNILKQAENIIQENNTNNFPLQSTQNAQNTHVQQVMTMQQEKAQNTNIKQILPIKNNSIQTYEESAKKYNIDTNNETVKSIDRITKLRGINASYNADLFSSNDANAIWRTHKDNNGNITREVILNPNADTKKALQNIIVHELTHDFEGTTEYKELKDLILSYDAGNVGFEKARESLGEIYSKVYARNSIEFQSLIDNEAVADILGNKLGTQEFIDTLTMQKPTTARKIYNWIIDKLNKLNKLTGYTNEKLFWQDVKNKFENAYRQDYKGSDIATKFDIITEGNKQYVKATRQVISGNDPLIWEQQVENYINETIRNGQDVQVLAYDGDILSITKDTAGKAKFRNEVIDKNGNKRRLNNKEFMAKLRAETHIDELAETSKHKQGPIPDTKNHSFAKDGFTYRTAYFEDIDGTYYRITMSVGKNGSINTIYNIGKMQNWQKNRRHSISELKGSSGKTTSDRISSTNSIPSSNENVNTTKYSMQESKNNTDNQGRTLSKEQQEYFKDSKVRDEKGNLLEVYHGSKNEFTVFDKSKIRTGITLSSNNGDGFYFTDSKKMVEEYSGIGKVYSVYLDIKNPFVVENNLSEETKKLLIEFSEQTYNKHQAEESKKAFGKYEVFNPNEIGKRSGSAILGKVVTIYGDEFTQFLKNNGYDGIKASVTDYHNTGSKYDYIVFEPNQIKNVDNINPTDNPDIRYSLPTKEWQQYLDENYKPTGTRTKLEDIRLPVKENSKKSSFKLPTNENDSDMIATILEKPAEKVKEKDRSLAIAKANLIDKGIVFEEISRKTGNRELQGKWDSTLNSTARAQNAIGNARYELDPKTKTQKQISKSLTDIIDEVGENTADFYAYMYHQLNIDRMTLEERFGGDTGLNYERKNPIMNKPVFGESVTAKMSIQKVAELEKKHPEFKEYAQDVYDYLDANTKELVDNGVISEETQQLFKDMYPHYVPISRVRNKGMAINVPLDTGRTGINSPIKKATGGSSDINPLFETMADRTLQTYRASARNSFGVELKNTINQTNQVSEETDIDTIMENMTDEEQNKQLLQEGKNGENPTFTVFENGNKVTYEITKDMYDALKPKNELLSKIDESKVGKIANKINNFRRGLLTEYNPVFSITNAIKDPQDILFNSQHPAKTYAKIPEATAQLLSKGYWYNEYIQNGGAQNSYFKDGEFETTKNNLPTKIKNTIIFPLRAISNVNNVIEMTPRLAEYIVSREQGKSVETSMLDAARVTTNFKAGGDITKTLNRNGFTFLNASVQGLQQQIRNIQEANAKGLKGYAVLACKYAIAGVPVLLLNNLIWKDDDEYEELQDYVKDNYYIIGKLPNGKFLRIPKGRAVATIQKIVSNVNDFIKNDSINPDEVGKVFWEDMKENIQFGIENLAPNNPMENNILSPIFQAITNKTWYGEDLVPTRLQNRPKEEQYNETTDNFSRWLGEKTGISPIKINYLIDQYSGGVGDILLPLGTPQAENNVIEDKFTTDATMKSKYPGEFFTKVDELEINKNSSKATDEDILKYKYISSVSTDIGELYTKKREIQNSSATDKEKKAQLKEIQEQINKLAKNSLEAVEKIQNTSTTATIGDKKYYKYHDEWTALSEEEIKKNKNISLKTYADYKNKVYNQTQTQRASGKLNENQSLKNKDKIQILLDSKYSNSEISAIYDNYIKSSSDTEYEIMKATGIDVKEYLKYKQQEFSSDKTDDGTLTGKTISKSKQKKVVEYLNSMNIKGNQRLLLYAMQGYTTTSSQKAQLASYVKSLKIDQDTKLKLYDKFSGFTVYKDGTVKW